MSPLAIHDTNRPDVEVLRNSRVEAPISNFRPNNQSGLSVFSVSKELGFLSFSSNRSAVSPVPQNWIPCAVRESV